MSDGGPAIPVVPVTDRPVSAAPALRVAVVSDGRPVEGGPTRPVYVVTDNRPTQGNTPMPVVLATGAQAGHVMAGAAIPVVVVSGSLSPTPPLNALFADLFTSGPVTSPRTAVPGPGTSVITDTVSGVSLNTATGTLSLDGPASTNGGWQKVGIADLTSRARADGLVAVFLLTDGDVEAQSSTLVNEHLAAGWFSSTNPANPVTDGNALIFRNNGTSGGALCRNGSDGASQTGLIDNAALPIIKQVEFYLIVALWSGGARYYVASLAGVRGLAAGGYPTMKLVHVAALNRATTPVFAGAFQRQALGGSTQIDAMVELSVAAWASAWYATAYAASSFIGAGSVSNPLAADVGGNWHFSTTSSAVLTVDGIHATGTGFFDLYMIDTFGNAPALPCGIVTMVVKTGAVIPDFGVGNVIRRSGTNYYYWTWQSGITNLYRTDAGVDTVVQSFSDSPGTNSTVVTVFIDDGTRLQLWRDNRKIFDYTTTTYANNTGVGIFCVNTGSGDFLTIKYLEHHARSMAVPSDITSLAIGTIWNMVGTTTVYTDTFVGPLSPLEGHTTDTGGGTWVRTLSNNPAVLKLNGGNKVTRDTGVAESSSIIYTLPWSAPTFADIQVDGTPKAGAYGAGNNARVGILCWQDANNWIGPRLFVDDTQVNSAEIEVQYKYNGAAATVNRRVNFGTEIDHGVTSLLRFCFDGNHFVVYLGTEPVFTWQLAYNFPSHVAWSINKVGLLSDSSDAGSLWDNFSARSA